MSNVDDFMQGGSRYPIVKMNTVGSKLVGDLIEARLVDERDYDTGQPVTWPDGEPKKQLVLDVRIDWSACEGDITTGKNGLREEIGSYYCRYTAFLALQAATEAAGCKMSEVGRVAIARTPDGTPRNPRHAPPQQFVAQVARRVAEPGVDDMLGGTPAEAAPAAQPAAQPAPATAAPGSLLG